MTPTEAALLCAYAEQCCPQQKFNEYTGDAWGDLLAEIRYTDAKEAVIAITRRSPWISPAEIIAEVRKMRAKRIDEYGPVTPPADLDPDDTVAYVAWWRDVQRQIADGDMKPKVLELPKRDMTQIENTFRRPPR